MNQILWQKIEAFNFDAPLSDYGFSTRLAVGNNWTKAFTVKAIEEYKKFMYLAGTSENMVSPSEIVDVVWHQHLIFTQSYNELCGIIDKQIQHIPSTHNKAQFEKFAQAKERTKILYNEAFGEQPPEIWAYSDMYASLHLPKASFKIRAFALIGIFAFVFMIIPFYWLLRPIYVQINNPYFMYAFVVFALFTLFVLEIFNRYYLKRTVLNIPKYSFIHNLNPIELVYLKSQKPEHVIHGKVDQLIIEKRIQVNDNYSLELLEKGIPGTAEDHAVLNTLESTGRTFYPLLLRALMTKPIFYMSPAVHR